MELEKEPKEDIVVDDPKVDEIPPIEEEKVTPDEEALVETEDDFKSQLEKAEAEKNAAFGATRKAQRESDIQIAELRGQIEALKPAEKKTDPEVAKSPFDIAGEKAEAEAIADGLKPDEPQVAFTPKLLREQQAFERDQRDQETETLTRGQSVDATNKAMAVASSKMDVAAMGKGLDFDTVLAESGELVTKEDMTWLASKSKDYADFYDRLYEFSKSAIISAGGDAAKLLQENIKVHSQENTENKIKEKLKPEEKILTQEEILGKATTVNEAQVNALM